MTSQLPAPPLLATAQDALWVSVEDSTATGTVRRRATELARRVGFGERRCGEVAIVATELATNLEKYAAHGTVVLRLLRRGSEGGLELVALDHGPGVRSIRALFADGTSTSGTLGIGLGAVARLASSVDAASTPGRGTVVVATLWPEADTEPGPPVVAGLTRPYPGETDCGDAYAIRRTERGHLLLLADGLGHGQLAAHASGEAVRRFHASPQESPAALLGELHRALMGTRGAAAAVAHVDTERRQVTYAGAGNIVGRIIGDASSRGLMSAPGIVGHNMRPARDLVHDLGPGRWVVMHSDGLSEKWDAGVHPQLLESGPLVIAATLLRDAGTRRDDASVLACRGAPW